MGLPLLARAQEITWEGRFDAALIAPQRVAVAESGQVLVSEPAWNRVRLLDADGTALASFGVHQPLAVGFDLDGRFLVGHDGRVEVWNERGRVLRALGAGAGEFQSPSDLAVTPDGRIYVTDGAAGLVKVYGRTGDFLFQFGQDGAFGALLHPTGIAYDAAQDRLLVGDQGHARILACGLDGTALASYGRYTEQDGDQWNFQGTFTRIQGLAVDAQGRIIVADSYQNNLQVLDGQGNFLAFIQPIADGQTRFSLPMDAAWQGQRLLVAANVASGLQAFRLEGFLGLPGDAQAQPDGFSLDAAWPNPFNASTTLAFTLGTPGEVTLSVVNLAGQTVATLAQGVLPAGRHLRPWSALAHGRDLSSGFYACRLQVTGADGVRRVATQKLLLLK